MLGAADSLGMSFRFGVVIDGFDLGSWTTCKGLAVTFKHEKVKELGEHTTNVHIPGWVEYPPISLQRAMTKNDWNKTKEWLQIVASAPWLATDSVGDVVNAAGEVDVAFGGNGVQFGGGGSASAGVAITGPSSGKITLFDSQYEEVASWELQNVMPAAWKGPQFDANGKAVAIETLDLIHEGFLVCANF